MEQSLSIMTYEAVRNQGSDVARERERMAFDRGIALMEAAAKRPDRLEPKREAVRYMQTLWGFLIRDLTDPANDLTDDLKDNLIAIGLFVMRETDRIIAGESEDWDSLIDINRTVREGLSS